MRRLHLDPGVRFGRLTVAEPRDRGPVRVRCDCGEERTVDLRNLRSGNTTSCGRCWRQGDGNPRYAHGAAGSSLYRVWSQIIQRCTNPRHSRYADYGGRGIGVCDEWRTFAAFRDAVGEPPHDGQRWTLDRIDNDAGYFPGNVRWATYSMQQRNRRPDRIQRPRNEKGQFVVVRSA
jgi:hypothetical protein